MAQLRREQLRSSFIQMRRIYEITTIHSNGRKGIIQDWNSIFLWNRFIQRVYLANISELGSYWIIHRRFHENNFYSFFTRCFGERIQQVNRLLTNGFINQGVFGQYGSNEFTSQHTIFSIGSSGGAGYNSPKSDSFTFGVAPVPYKGSAQYVTQGVTLTILRNPSYSDADNDARVYYAWKFAKYITNPEVNAVLCVEDSQGYVPVRESAYETDDYLEFLSDDTNIYSSTAKIVMKVNEMTSMKYWSELDLKLNIW